MKRWDLAPAAQMVTLSLPADEAMELGDTILDVITHLDQREGYDLHVIEDVAQHAAGQVTWYCTSCHPTIADFLSAVVALQTLAAPRWKHLKWRVIPAEERYHLALSTTLTGRCRKIYGPRADFAEIVATFDPSPGTGAIVLDGQPTAELLNASAADTNSDDWWQTFAEWDYYEAAMFAALKQWAVVGNAGVPIIDVHVTLTHIVFHSLDSSPRAFALAMMHACAAIFAERSLIRTVRAL